MLDNNKGYNLVDDLLSDYQEISDRFWESYLLLTQEDKKAIEKVFLQMFISSNMALLNSEVIMNNLLLIIPRLGLKQTFDFIINNERFIQNDSIKEILSSAILEYGQTVENPFSGMED